MCMYRGRSSGSQTAWQHLRPHCHHATTHAPIHASRSIVQLPSGIILFEFLHKVPLAVSTEVHPGVVRDGVAHDVARRGAGRLSNVRAPLARVVSRCALEPAALVSHGWEKGRAPVGGEGLSVDDREVEPRLAGTSVDGQLQLVLVRVGDLGVWGALHDGADVVLQSWNQRLGPARRVAIKMAVLPATRKGGASYRFGLQRGPPGCSSRNLVNGSEGSL